MDKNKDNKEDKRTPSSVSGKKDDKVEKAEASKGTSSSGKIASKTRSTSGGAKVDESPTMLAQILSELKGLTSKTTAMASQIDSQAEHLSHLDDEFKIKFSSMTNVDQQRKLDNDDGGSQVSVLSEHSQFTNSQRGFAPSDIGSDDEDGELFDGNEDPYEATLYGRVKKGVVPSSEEIEAFKKLVKLSEEDGEEDWLSVKAKSTTEYWNGKTEAKDFMGPRPDPDVPDLKYKNKKTLEKDLSEVHRMTGAMAIAEMRLVEEIKILVADCNLTMEEFMDPQIDITNPRTDAAASLSTARDKVTNLLKTIGSMGKMARAAYIKILQMRRRQYLEGVDRSKGAMEMVRRLKPSTRLLFGNGIQSVCRTLKDGHQLNKELQKDVNFAGAGRGYNPRMRGNGAVGRGRVGRGFRPYGPRGAGKKKDE